jgi:ferredoxin
MRTPSGDTYHVPWFESDVYLCGPIKFNDTLRTGLIDLGTNPDLIFVEDFAAAAKEPETPLRQTDASVGYGSRCLDVRWVAAQELTLLELAEAHGLDLPYDCRAGTCRTCESDLLSGDIDGSATNGGNGTRRVLLCTSYPLSDTVVVEPPSE